MTLHAITAVLLLAAVPAFPGNGKPAPIKVTLKSSTGADIGTAELKQKSNGVELKLNVHDLPAGLHGVHIHAKGVCDAPDFKGAGGHFNPTDKKHGFENPDGHHMGDTNRNLEVMPNHAGMAEWLFQGVSLDPNAGDKSITANGGTAIVIHEHADDEKTDPSGNSGNRIACGVIQP